MSFPASVCLHDLMRTHWCNTSVNCRFCIHAAVQWQTWHRRKSIILRFSPVSRMQESHLKYTRHEKILYGFGHLCIVYQHEIPTWMNNPIYRGMTRCLHCMHMLLQFMCGVYVGVLFSGQIMQDHTGSITQVVWRLCTPYLIVVGPIKISQEAPVTGIPDGSRTVRGTLTNVVSLWFNISLHASHGGQYMSGICLIVHCANSEVVSNGGTNRDTTQWKVYTSWGVLQFVPASDTKSPLLIYEWELCTMYTPAYSVYAAHKRQ